MKILHIVNSLATGGAEKLILETVPKYNEMGLQCDVLLLDGTNHPFLDELRKKNCCKIFVLGKGSPYRLHFIFKIIPFLKKYDLVHAHLFPVNYFTAIAKKISFVKTPIVFTEHNTSNRRFRNKNLRKLNSKIYRHFNRIVCITEEVKREVKRHAMISEKQLSIIHNGVDISKYSDAKLLPVERITPLLTDKDFLLLQVSSFREQKDQQTIIKALTFLPPHVKLLLAGEGPLKEECMTLVQQLDLQNRVFFLGNRSDIPQLLKTSDINILSSFYEGLSLASIEGMASGKPFIASDVPGLAGVVGGYGVLFPQGNAEVLANEILKLMNNEELYHKVALKCTERAKDFDIGKMVEQHILLYKDLVSTAVQAGN